MKKTLVASLALMLGWGGTAFAQSEVDVLRYSQLGVTGTARIQGMGGAQSALGADISSLSGNPAGLGMFRRSEFTITPGVQTLNNSASIFGSGTSGSKSNFVLPQLGVVIANRRGDNDNSDWRGTTFGIGLTRLNNFNERFTSYGTQSGEVEPTIVEYFADLAAQNGRTEADLDAEFGNYRTLEGLAYGAYLFNFDDDGNIIPELRGGAIGQREEIIREGSQNQIDIGFGASYRDKLYIGASLGIVSLDFYQERIYTETETDVTTPFTSLTYRDEFWTTGAGVNLKVGLIARPTDALRLGLSVQTPTAYSMDDEYQRSISTDFSDGPTEVAAEVPGQFAYRMVTPFRATGGVAVFAGKYGFISADVEYVNYGSAKFRDQDDSSSGGFFDDINEGIEQNNSSAVNYRIGAEGRYEVFRLRAGYAYNADPDNGSSYNSGFVDQQFGATKSYTLGAGVRLKNFYVDAAYVRTQQDVKYAPFVAGTNYTPFRFGGGPEPAVAIDRKQDSVLLTLGFNF